MVINTEFQSTTGSPLTGRPMRLKLKYTHPTAKGPKSKASTGAAGVKKVHKTGGLGQRRRAYGPFNTF